LLLKKVQQRATKTVAAGALDLRGKAEGMGLVQPQEGDGSG